jgi:hypothetical protein
MRSSTFSNLAILATSLLARDALAAPYERRAADVKNVVVTEIATVTKHADGSLMTGSTNAIAVPPPAEPTPITQADKAAAIDTPGPAAPSSSGDSTTSSPSGSKLSSKRGLPYNQANLLEPFTGSGSQATWCYNWDSTPGNIPSGLEYVPMLHGLDGDHLNPWVANANAALAAGATHLQYINEPDVEVANGGVNTSPQDAADGYVKNMMPFKGKAKIGSPAVSNGDAGGPQGKMGIPYLNDFFSKCGSCHFDFVPFHWYGTSPDDFKKHVQDVRDAAKAVNNVAKDANGLPTLWITEFGFNNGTPDTISDFLKVVMPWLDSQDYVERYAYQWVADGFLVTGTTPNLAGKTFAGLT